MKPSVACMAAACGRGGISAGSLHAHTLSHLCHVHWHEARLQPMIAPIAVSKPHDCRNAVAFRSHEQINSPGKLLACRQHKVERHRLALWRPAPPWKVWQEPSCRTISFLWPSRGSMLACCAQPQTLNVEREPHLELILIIDVQQP